MTELEVSKHDEKTDTTKPVLSKGDYFPRGWYFEAEDWAGDWELIGPFTTRSAAESERQSR